MVLPLCKKSNVKRLHELSILVFGALTYPDQYYYYLLLIRLKKIRDKSIEMCLRAVDEGFKSSSA